MCRVSRALRESPLRPPARRLRAAAPQGGARRPRLGRALHVCGDEVGHRDDLGVALVGLGLLRVERVDVRVHQHVGQHQILEALDAALRARLVVVLEGLEEVGVRLFPLALRHEHFAAALANHAHDARVRDRALDLQRLRVEVRELLGVLGRGVQLDLERVHLEQLRPLPLVVRPVLGLSGEARARRAGAAGRGAGGAA